jgi:hypothetical protein
MKRILTIATLCLQACYSHAQLPQTFTVAGPDRQLQVKISATKQQQWQYAVQYNGQPVLAPSALGVIRTDGDFSKGLTLEDTAVSIIANHYVLRTGKRRECNYMANELTLHLRNAKQQPMDIIFRVSDNGVAFRYFFPDHDTAVKSITAETTSFHFNNTAKAWLQPMSDAKTGWEQVNPCYEEYYKKEIAVGAPSPTKSGWVFPALFRAGNVWALISETAVDGSYCASRLNNAQGTAYTIGFPGPQEVFPGGGHLPQSRLPWYTPWRIIAVGPLAAIAASTLGTDLAPPAVNGRFDFVKPGKAAWSWALLKDNSVTYATQKRFIDYAAGMHWEYCLIDVDWDTRIGYDSVQLLVSAARQKNVGVWLWYNSAGSWNTTPYHPRNQLLTHDAREQEFSRLQKMGVAGVKIDFFGGDGQSMIQYYQEILQDAAAHHLMVNFHGATLPRGWQRTYPNLVTAEAIKGFEYITFAQENANEEPAHCATLPFTRNAFDPMDFTPMCLYKIPGIQRVTTAAFELALPVIFLSGVQHLAETPEGMAHMPPFIKTFLSTLPAAWDDVRFIDGYPGRYVVLARKAGRKWYIAGINAGAPRALTLRPADFGGRRCTLFTGAGADEYFTQHEYNGNGPTEIKMGTNDGFVAVIEE